MRVKSLKCSNDFIAKLYLIYRCECEAQKRMTEKDRQYQKRGTVKLFCRLFILLSLVVGVSGAVVYAAGTGDNNLQNGSFEEGQTFTKDYTQPDQSLVPSWNTTAFQGKIELFRKNINTYISGVTLEPKDGTYAAELNADEESTLYQNVKTTPSSVYEWGLDHGGRNGTDIMALVIGPKQSVDPSKPSKDGRDQLMQMVDWLNIDNSTITAGAEPKQYTVYSKKFAASGTFEDNAGNNAFSLTPSTIYTEEWHIWIMASSKATSGTNPWNSYGANAEGSAGSSNGIGSTTVDLSKYYLYTVPAGQKDTLFGFVSVGYVNSSTTADKAKTYGNFLDNINFQLYHPLSSSTTDHGSAVVGGSDGTTEGEGGSDGHEVTVNNKLATYITDGEPLKIQAIVKKADADAGCEFVGLYYTTLDENGDPVTKFLQLAGNEIEDTGSLTEEQKKGKWIKSTNTDGDIIYTYYLENITSATDLHFVFIKNPTITYDPNGGKAYVVERTYNTEEAPNVYNFKPAVLTGNTSGVDTTTGATPTTSPTEKFISPYVSHAAEGQNDGWKFMGWLLTGDTVDNIPSDVAQVNAGQLGSLLLPAVHTVACDYSLSNVSTSAAQYFKIYGESVTTSATLNKENGEVKGVTWTDNGETKVYANVHKGLTMVAQWRWRQAFIPQVDSSTNYTDSANGGTVEIASVTDKSDTNYNAAYNANGGKSYHAETDETITATATAKDGFTFEGWYDASGNLITTNTTYTYTETKASVNTYYARFSGSVTQTYIRQIKNGDTWEDTTDDKIGTLGRYTYTDAVGTPISSTATAGTGYKFLGWYDEHGKPVADTMLTNDGKTIRYVTTGDATYYARFSRIIVTFDPNGGNVTPTSDIAIEGKLNNLPVPTRSNYNFDGWFTQPSGGTIVTIDRIYTEDTTIYAHWSYAGGEEPGTGGDKPDTGGEDPGTGEDNPGSGGEDPGTGEDNPGSGSEDPGTGEDNPGSGSEDPGTSEDNPGSSSGNHENVEHNSTAENLPPRTADDSDLVIWFMLLALSMCCFTAFLIKSKHSSEENHK